jgi:hypothetical protein
MQKINYGSVTKNLHTTAQYFGPFHNKYCQFAQREKNCSQKHKNIKPKLHYNLPFAVNFACSRKLNQIKIKRKHLKKELTYPKRAQRIKQLDPFPLVRVHIYLDIYLLFLKQQIT